MNEHSCIVDSVGLVSAIDDSEGMIVSAVDD